MGARKAAFERAHARPQALLGVAAEMHTLAVQNGGLLLLNRIAEVRQVLAEFLAVSRTREWDFLSMQGDGCAFLAVLERRPRSVRCCRQQPPRP